MKPYPVITEGSQIILMKIKFISTEKAYIIYYINLYQAQRDVSIEKVTNRG
jgi:hypothetical protein